MVSMAQAHGVTMEHHAVEGQESTLNNNSHKDWYLGHKDPGPCLAEEIDYNWGAHIRSNVKQLFHKSEFVFPLFEL